MCQLQKIIYIAIVKMWRQTDRYQNKKINQRMYTLCRITL